jgi:hypothetical protein
MAYNRNMELRDIYIHLQMKRLEVGDRVELIDMPDDPNPIPEGTLGTVESMTDDSFDGTKYIIGVKWDDEYIIGVKWDNGRTLNLCSKVDRVIKLEK